MLEIKQCSIASYVMKSLLKRKIPGNFNPTLLVALEWLITRKKLSLTSNCILLVARLPQTEIITFIWVHYMPFTQSVVMATTLGKMS